jgi:hypothetical protein
MEAVPRLPMLSFDLKVSPESTSFGPQLKQVQKNCFSIYCYTNCMFVNLLKNSFHAICKKC